MQSSPDGQASVLVWHDPADVQSRFATAPVPLHEALPHTVPADSRRQPPDPSHPFEQASSLQTPLGSGSPEPTGLHVPSDPRTLQDLHVPEQEVAQHRPCAQVPDTHSSLLLH
jgi:hypothetical protein